jgi:hypothetical protein
MKVPTPMLKPPWRGKDQQKPWVTRPNSKRAVSGSLTTASTSTATVAAYRGLGEPRPRDVANREAEPSAITTALARTDSPPLSRTDHRPLAGDPFNGATRSEPQLRLPGPGWPETHRAPTVARSRRGVSRQDGRDRILQAPGEPHLADHLIHRGGKIEGKPTLHGSGHPTPTGLGAPFARPSSNSTLRPDLARWNAAEAPAGPAPTTIASTSGLETVTP